MPIEPRRIDFKVGHVAEPNRGSELHVTIVAVEGREAYVRLWMYDPRSRRDGEMIRLGDVQLTDLEAVLAETRRLVELMRANGTIHMLTG